MKIMTFTKYRKINCWTLLFLGMSSLGRVQNTVYFNYSVIWVACEVSGSDATVVLRARQSHVNLNISCLVIFFSFLCQTTFDTELLQILLRDQQNENSGLRMTLSYRDEESIECSSQ